MQNIFHASQFIEDWDFGDAHIRHLSVFIGLGNGLAPVRRQAKTWTIADLFQLHLINQPRNMVIYRWMGERWTLGYLWSPIYLIMIHIAVWHDDVIKWKHFSALLAFCAGNSPVPVNSPHKGQWRGALMFYLYIVWWEVWSMPAFSKSGVMPLFSLFNPLQWRHNGRDSVSNHQPHHC